MPPLAKRVHGLLEADAASGRSLRDLVRLQELLVQAGARFYGTPEAPALIYGSELMHDGERVRQAGVGATASGEEKVVVEIDRGTLVFTHRPGTRTVRLGFAPRPGVARALRTVRLLDRQRQRRDQRMVLALVRLARPRERRAKPRTRRIRVRSGSRGDPPEGDTDDGPSAARRVHRPAGAAPDSVATRSAW